MSVFIHECATRGIEPDRSSVLGLLGYPADTEPADGISDLVDRAFELFHRTAAPRGISTVISVDEFDTIWPGEGMNDPEAVLGPIYSLADRLALSAVTLGQEVSETITRLFDENDFAFATIFDAVASGGADRLADVMMQAHLERFDPAGEDPPGIGSLLYSPGYCGWHVSGQRALFRRLQPGQIGIELLESCLMRPSKSVSGVIVTGPVEIHHFVPDFGYCADCATKSCRERIASLAG